MTKTVGICACSNAQTEAQRPENQALEAFLTEAGCRVKVSPCIYGASGPFSGTGKERAQALTELFADPEITDIYDISGGDLGNEVLDFLDFDKIRTSRAVFWGYSDLTVVLNAIYTKTGKSGVLYSAKNLVRGDFQSLQRQRFLDREALFTPAFRMVQGRGMEGVVAGGNLRCFLKLAGTPYFPDLTGKVLLLEACGGKEPQMVTYLSQLRSCGVFDKIQGILLGTFSMMEAEGLEILPLVQAAAGREIPIAMTRDIGHGADAKAIRIGETIRIGSPL